MAMNRKPRIALMGEFSSGKSTLCNVLLGARPLLEKVTATQLPPVWLSYGTAPAYSVGLDGQKWALDVADLGSVQLEGTEHVRIFMKSDLLRYCDLIDMPGISDPSMSSEVWERMTYLADGVLWCTPANQAWRQSESGVWSTFPEGMRRNALLLVTRFDKIVGDSDRAKVLKRVAAETDGLFAGFFPMALTQAMAAGDDEVKWVDSGAHDATTALFELIHRLIDEGVPDENVPAIAGENDYTPEPDAVKSLIAEHFERLMVIRNTPVVKILPRRVQAKGDRIMRTERPTAEQGETVVSFSDSDWPDIEVAPKPKEVDMRSVMNQSKGS
ncbi:dynamin family protein [Tabrizicola sp.]|uniref:dynamin family protein n=1 Tax=Tabrizicola sp. TaxID=2005166 RepID=UPI003F3272A1